MYEKDVDFVLPVVKKEADIKNNNKKILMILIALAVVIIITGIVVGSYFFPKSIKGDWELIVNPEINQATPDEVNDSDRVYYTFNKPDKYGDGTYRTYYDGGVEEGGYKLSENGGEILINMGTEDLKYKITGSKLLGNAKLVITIPQKSDDQTEASDLDYVFVQSNSPKYEKESYSSFEIDEALIGKWITKERTLAYYMYELAYTQTVDFSDNGIMTIHYESTDLALNRYMYYAYTANEGELSFSLVTDKETKYSVSYEFDDNENLRFSEDNTQNSIFADAFFSTFTYYTPDNLPKEVADESSTTEQ